MGSRTPCLLPACPPFLYSVPLGMGGCREHSCLTFQPLRNYLQKKVLVSFLCMSLAVPAWMMQQHQGLPSDWQLFASDKLALLKVNSIVYMLK